MSTTPSPTGQPEYLDPAGGDPVGPGRKPGGRRGLLVVGGLAAALLVGGTAYGAWWYFSSGAQPAEALPASTVGYVGVDLDPSGQQLLAARETLEKFPAWREQEVSDRDDLREWFVEQISAEAGCDLDYAADVEPWLGDRLAVAAVDTGDDAPTPVVVVQVTDGDAADEGLATIAACGDGETGGWSVEGDWAVVAETEDIAAGVLADAAESSLADDEDFARWTGEAGDAGIVTMYAAPEAAGFVQGEVAGDAPPEELQNLLDEFEGMAGTVRFADGSLEMELAVGAGENTDLVASTGGDVIATLPEDTAMALGMGVSEGWFSQLVENLAEASGGEMTAAELLEEMTALTGLDLPEDAETLLGESLAIAVGGDLDPEALINSGDPGQVPLAIKVRGDSDAIEDILGQVTGGPGLPLQELLNTAVEGDVIAVGPDQDYIDAVVADGGLGETPAFRDVVGDIDDAAAVFFLNLDVLDEIAGSLTGGDDEVSANLEPLAAFGITGWMDDGVGHATMRLTTD